MQAELSLAIASAGAVKDLALALISERDRQKAAAIEIDLTKKVLDVQLQLAEVLTASIAKDAVYQAQSQRIAEIEAAQRQKQRYRLSKVGAIGAFFAYALRPSAELLEEADEPEHFICQPCFDIRQQKSILRFVGSYCTCPSCGRKEQVVLVEARPPRVMHVAKGFQGDW